MQRVARMPLRSHDALRSMSLLFMVSVVAASCCNSGTNTRRPFGGHLPPTVTDLHEEHVDMFPDWEYYFRATMPSPDCDVLLANVVREEKLTLIAEHDWKDGKGDWGPGRPPAWWKPNDAGGHYHGRAGDVNTCAMCREGKFYYFSGSH